MHGSDDLNISLGNGLVDLKKDLAIVGTSVFNIPPDPRWAGRDQERQWVAEERNIIQHLIWAERQVYQQTSDARRSLRADMSGCRGPPRSAPQLRARAIHYMSRLAITQISQHWRWYLPSLLPVTYQHSLAQLCVIVLANHFIFCIDPACFDTIFMRSIPSRYKPLSYWLQMPITCFRWFRNKR